MAHHSILPGNDTWATRGFHPHEHGFPFGTAITDGNFSQGNSNQNHDQPEDPDREKSPDPATTFRGFPQPPVDERLQSIKTFLADEDPDRHLYWGTRFAEINDYLDHIDKHDLDCDSALLKHVKGMAQVHKDWQKARDRQLPSGCVHANVKPSTKNSTRLIDIETAAKILEQQKAFGVDIQTRTDHPPFTVTSTDDEVEFNRAMLKDAAANPLTIDRETNLLWVESRGYDWALLNPAMIPYWMHPTDGIPTTGQKVPADPLDKEPWYLTKQPVEAVKNRPVRRPLPEYLQARENTINRLMKKKSLSITEFARLENLLRLHEPMEIRRLYAKWQQELSHSEGNETAASTRAKEKYHTARNEWLDAFRFDGVYLMVLQDGDIPIQEPGVFYLPTADVMTEAAEHQARSDQVALDQLVIDLRRKGGYRFLSTDQKYALDLLLIRFSPEPFRFQKDAAKFSSLSDDDPLAASWRLWVDSITESAPRIILLRPGEMEREDSDLLCIPWQPHSEPNSRRNRPTTAEDKVWETEALVKKHMDPRFELSTHEKARLGHLVVDSYEPLLSKPHQLATEERERREADENAAALATPGGNRPRKKPKKMQNRNAYLKETLQQLKDMCDHYQEVRRNNLEDREYHPEAAARGEFQEVSEIDEEFIEEFTEWFKTIYADKNLISSLGVRLVPKIDFTGKAERRGIQRAAIEIALNLLATNQEQHRPEDRFRVVKLPPPYKPVARETPLSLPLEPHKRPVERDTFEFSQKVAAYHQQKDYDYQLGRKRLENCMPGQIPAPSNYNGPFVIVDGVNKHMAAKDRLHTLTRYKAGLAAAQEDSPRPLMQQMLRRIAWYSNPESKLEEGLEPEFSPLDQRDLDLIDELAGQSWDESAEEYDWTSFAGDQHEINLFIEFERDLLERDLMAEIPLWQAPIDHSIPIEDDIALCEPASYDPTTISATGISLTDLVQRIRNRQLSRGVEGKLQLWTEQKALEFLKFMKAASRIHLDIQRGEEPQISRVPLTGHPENKYVASVEDALSSPGVYLTSAGQLEVRYNADGFRGPPIVQPNRIQHFLRLAQILGREILDWIETLAVPALSWAPADLLAEQLDDMEKVKKGMKEVTIEDRIEHGLSEDLAKMNLDLKTLATELNEYAPDLAQEAGFDWTEDIEEPDTEDIIRNPKTAREARQTKEAKQSLRKWQKRQSEYASLLQMQILEEINNNWESRFPEQEHVWDFASPRVAPRTETLPSGKEIQIVPRQRQFFSMRRWPLDCQSPEAQKKIAESGNPVPEKPVPPVPAPEKTREQIIDEAITPQKKKTRHIRGRAPHFPFGETTYQQAYLSYRMEQDLKDVPEFQVKPDNRWNFPWTTRPNSKTRTTNPFALPRIPSDWKPDNISRAQKKHELIEWARREKGFPDPTVLENYYTQEEIPYVIQQEEAEKLSLANQALEGELKKSISEAKEEEIVAARVKLDINPNTGFFLLEEEKALKARVEAVLMKRTERLKKENKFKPKPIAVDGAGIPTVSRGSPKRNASGQTGVDGQRTPKRTRRG